MQGLFAGPQSAASQKGTNTVVFFSSPFLFPLLQKDRFMTQKSIIILRLERTVENLRSRFGRVENELIPSSSHPSAPTEEASCCGPDYLDMGQGRRKGEEQCLCASVLGLLTEFF